MIPAGLRVLVVEDDMILAFMIEDLLNDLDCRIVATEMRLACALETARVASIDLALLDINLNGERSFPVADILHERGVPFVFATGYDASAVPERFAGRSVLTKPFNAADLRMALESTLTPS